MNKRNSFQKTIDRGSLNATPLFWQTKRPPFFGKLNATGPTQGGAFTFSILIGKIFQKNI